MGKKKQQAIVDKSDNNQPVGGVEGGGALSDPLSQKFDMIGTALQQLAENDKKLFDNDKVFDEQYKQLSLLIQNLARTESQPIVVERPGDPKNPALNLFKGIDMGKIMDLITTLLKPTPPPSETGAIFTDKEMVRMWKDKMKRDWEIDQGFRQAQTDSLIADNVLKKKRAEGELF